MSKKVEEYIENYTKRCSNEDGFDYVPWLTPDNARKAVEIAREEVIEAAAEWLKENAKSYVYWMDEEFGEEDLVKDFRKYMEDK